MEIILVRHGEPDYSETDCKESPGFGHLAPLIADGIKQAHAVLKMIYFQMQKLLYHRHIQGHSRLLR